MGVGVLAAVAVVGEQPGREREDQRRVGELHDRIGPREAELRQAFERAPASDRDV